MTVRIITDSTCDLPAGVISDLGITVVPLYIHVGNRDYLDGIDITRDEFYAKLPTFRHHPTTAVPSLQKFRAVYEALAEEGASEILSIHISATLSAILDVARKAAEETTTAVVTAFDSRQLSLGMGFLVEKAAMMALEGHSAREILVALERQIKRTHVAAALNTLEFLKRSGRMNSVMSMFGEFLQIKPILKMYDGVSEAERVRTRKGALKRLVEMLKKYSPYEKLAFLHSEALGQAQALRDEVSELLPDQETWIGVINPVLGTHIGPGVVGFACVTKE
jgi:DegV family protein with EDD domain